MSPDLNASISYLLRKYPTPFYLFDLRTMKDAVDLFRSTFSANRLTIDLAYSIKTNPIREIVDFFLAHGLWAEATSGEEIAKSKFEKELLFNGIYKKDEEVEEAIRRNAVIVLDGALQTEQVKRIASGMNRLARIGIRLSTYPYMKDPGTRFGFQHWHGETDDILRDIKRFEYLSLELLHTNIGTNVAEPQIYGIALNNMLKVARSAQRLGLNIKYFDLGGGMPAPLDQAWLFRLCQNLSDQLGDFRDQTRLVFEPGRSLVQQAGFLITKVVDVRARLDCSGSDIILDAGTNSIMGHPYGSRYEYFYPSSHVRTKATPSRIFGPLCSALDMIDDEFYGSIPAISEILTIGGVGAYDYSTSYSFSGRQPLVAILDLEGEARIIDISA